MAGVDTFQIELLGKKLPTKTTTIAVVTYTVPLTFNILSYKFLSNSVIFAKFSTILIGRFLQITILHHKRGLYLVVKVHSQTFSTLRNGPNGFTPLLGRRTSVGDSFVRGR